MGGGFGKYGGTKRTESRDLWDFVEFIELSWIEGVEAGSSRCGPD